MRRMYLVAYDICDDARLRRVHKKMRGYGERVQYSVFCCELSAMEKAQMMADLDPLIHHREDQVLIFPLGPVEGFNHRAVQALGRPYQWVQRHAVVV